MLFFWGAPTCAGPDIGKKEGSGVWTLDLQKYKEAPYQVAYTFLVVRTSPADPTVFAP